MPRPLSEKLSIVAVAVAVVAGVAFRLVTRSDLWLDEALSVNIATLPLGDLVDALARDGHPPLYYVLLQAWTELFGTGDVAVRALSGVFGIATLPVLWLAARRYAGAAGAVATVVLAATSPFLVRYATEARMYALVMFLVTLGWLAVQLALERPTPARLIAVAVLAGLLALTHYWSLYLLATVFILLLLAWRRGRASAGRVAIGMAAGGLVFAPWLPTFLDQMGKTGTPWGEPERPTNVLTIALADWGGGTLGASGEAQLLGAGIGVLVLLALFARRLDERRLEVDLGTRPKARPEVLAVFGTMALAVVAGYATESAFASRYTAVVIPLVLLVAGLGAAVLPAVPARMAVIVLLAALGLAGSVRNVTTDRTQLGDIARTIAAQGQPGDLVAVCPDQLGPALTRVLPDDFAVNTYPDGENGRFVNWVDYADRMASREPADFAREVSNTEPDRALWVVWSPGYRTLDERCEDIVNTLGTLRPATPPVIASGAQFEHAWLYRYEPAPG